MICKWKGKCETSPLLRKIIMGEGDSLSLDRTGEVVDDDLMGEIESDASTDITAFGRKIGYEKFIYDIIGNTTAVVSDR